MSDDLTQVAIGILAKAVPPMAAFHRDREKYHRAMSAFLRKNKGSGKWIMAPKAITVQEPEHSGLTVRPHNHWFDSSTGEHEEHVAKLHDEAGNAHAVARDAHLTGHSEASKVTDHAKKATEKATTWSWGQHTPDWRVRMNLGDHEHLINGKPTSSVRAIHKGEFRGGDPEWLAQKKKEKEEEEGDTLSAAIAVLKASEEGEGAFRGGDPELLQQKREEKRLQREEESGGADESVEPAEEPDLSDIEEAKQKDEDRKEAAGKAFPFAVTESGHEVSPVDTLEDYRPRNSNGDPLDSGNLYPTQKDIEPGPPRRGPNQWKPWSEVLGFKVPPEGAPWQHLRRYVLSGDSPEKIQHEAQLLTRSLILGLEEYPESTQKVHNTFFSIYDNLNRGLTWDPNYQIYKAEKGEVVPGHKYVYRKMGDDGKWQYEYATAPHSDNHGIQHTGNMQGHTVDIHPEWEAQNLDPTHSNPEAAFHHARAKAMEEGGNYKLPVLNKDTMQHENKILTIKPGIQQPLELRDESEKEPGKPEGKAKNRFFGFEGLEEHVRRNHVNTEHDIHGNPWVQWMFPKAGTKTKQFEEIEGEKPEARKKRLAKHQKEQEKTRIKMRYMPGHPYARPVPKKTESGGWHQGPDSISSFKKRIADEKNDQLANAGLVESEKKPIKLDPTSDKPYTEAIQGGQLKRKKTVVPIIHRVTERNPETGKIETTEKQRAGSRRVWTADWHSDKEKTKVAQGLYEEHKGLATHIADSLVKKLNIERTKKGQERIEGRLKNSVVEQLTTEPFIVAIKRAVRTYNPKVGTKFATYLHNLTEGEQKGHLYHAISTAMAESGKEITHEDLEDQRNMDEAVASAPSAEEEPYHEFLDRARNHVNSHYQNWHNTQSGTAAPEDKEEKKRQWRSMNSKIDEMENVHNTPDHDLELDDPSILSRHVKEDHISHEFLPMSVGSEHADEISNHMRKKTGDISPEKMERDHGPATKISLSDLNFTHPDLTFRIKSEHLKTLADLMGSLRKRPFPPEMEIDTNKELKEKYGQAAEMASKMSKAAPQQPEAQPLDVTYLGQYGEFGAPKFLYEAGPGGNVVQGTNAPEGHPDHAPELGSPQAHEAEPSPETNPELFDEQGRKLDRPIPQNAEVENNPNYDPNKENGNYWVKKFADPQTGEAQYAYLHRDHVLDPKMKNNLSIKYLDAQLPKIRTWYQSMLSSEEPSEKALGLFVALVDQGRMSTRRLESLKVSDVRFGDGNVVTFKSNEGDVKVTLDPTLRENLDMLLKDKHPDDPVFYIDGNVLNVSTLNNFMHTKFGVLPSVFLTYHITKDFSVEFQKLSSKIKGKSSLDYMQAIKNQVIHKIADDFGILPDEVERLIDPIAVEASIMSAYLHRDSINKSDHHDIKEKFVFQGLPISIENKKGSTREWYDPNAAKHGKTKMYYDYGYIRHTLGTDKDHYDVYVGPNKNSNIVYIVHQMKAPSFSKFDEDKAMVGFNSETEAKEAYLKQYDDPKFFGSMTAMPVEEFKKKVFNTINNPHMIKSTIHIAVSDKINRSPDEEAFSQWVHSYPIHEHEMHWQALLRHHQREQGKQEQVKQIESQQPQGILYNNEVAR
jgi:hypothetical protein